MLISNLWGFFYAQRLDFDIQNKQDYQCWTKLNIHSVYITNTFKSQGVRTLNFHHQINVITLCFSLVCNRDTVNAEDNLAISLKMVELLV